MKTEQKPVGAKDKINFSFSWAAIVVRGIVGTCISVFVYTQAHRIEDSDTLSQFKIFSTLTTQAIQKELQQSADPDFNAVVRNAVNTEYRDAARIYIFDNQGALAAHFNGPAVEDPEALSTDEFTQRLTLKLGDKQWEAVFLATPSFTAYTWQGAIAAGIGTFITLFIVVTAWILLEVEKRQFTHVLHEDHVHEMENTVDQLEITKNRLVAQENLASLGGLTAGIAHEIKNPLNFINNFSTLSGELIDTLENFIRKHQTAIEQNELDEMENSIMTLRENIRTIHEQGSRADSTIQRMLAHSRGKPGEWMMTDIHKLLEEYINFSYHGMRAKTSSFNVKIEKNFDRSIEKIEVVANDMSRVFLNLLNNAFQSVDEKRKKLGSDYRPEVTITTQNVGNYFRIRIRDNGTGIKEENKGNIFTPFFTTKPTGLGTGLGLSLSYNIIVREHKGSLTFESKEGEFCEFIITIPKVAKKEKEVVANENINRG